MSGVLKQKEMRVLLILIVVMVVLSAFIRQPNWGGVRLL